jgi:RHH-type proline utilization regulon transcriptional repressor/proline dehydrogenase/delta 1-pyrroline-5-carboxylate dehydrogenase
VGQSQEPVQKRLIEAMDSLLLKPAHDFSCKVPPVIDDEAHRRLMDIVNDPGCDVEVLYRRKPDCSLPHGYYVPPTLLKVKSAEHFLMQQELFGPVLTIIHVDSFDEALKVANSTEFALTSSIFSRTPGHLERASREMNVGNLYLNRGCTGAMVGRQPFGGHKMSGVGTKAGGPYYLMHFVDPRIITENTMRRGFTPEIES